MLSAVAMCGSYAATMAGWRETTPTQMEMRLEARDCSLRINDDEVASPIFRMAASNRLKSNYYYQVRYHEHEI